MSQLDLSVSTVIGHHQTLGLDTVWSYCEFFTPDKIPWLIHVNKKVDWVHTNVGHRRLEALDMVKSKYVLCFDSDDILLRRLPLEEMSQYDVDFFIFNCIRQSGEARSLLSKRVTTNSAVHRVVFRTEFLKKILAEFVESTYLREDVYMMWRAFDCGTFKYFPIAIHRKFGHRCVKDELFKYLNIAERKSFWQDKFNDDFLKKHNKRMVENIVKL